MVHLPKFPNLPDPENVFSIIDKTGDAIDKGLGIIDKVVDKFDRATEKFAPPEERTPQGSSVSETSENKTTYGVTEKDTLLYQLDHLLIPLRQLEYHLSEGCRIAGVPCDCCQKSGMDIRIFSNETIPIAARMEKETSIYQDITSWASHIEEIGTQDKVESGEYDETYRKESGTASKFRKRVQSMISELKKEEECPGCEEMRESISRFIEKKKRERAGIKNHWQRQKNA